ncbi:MAG: hypothetical protein ACXWC5_22355 [Burkholderiales bacterium]
MATEITLTPQPIRLTAAARQALYLAVDISPFDSLDLEAVCVFEGTATNAIVNIYTGMQLDTEDGWVLAGAVNSLSGTGQQIARLNIPGALLRFVRWDISSLGGATAITFFIRGMARSNLTQVAVGIGYLAQDHQGAGAQTTTLSFANVWSSFSFAAPSTKTYLVVVDVNTGLSALTGSVCGIWFQLVINTSTTYSLYPGFISMMSTLPYYALSTRVPVSMVAGSNTLQLQWKSDTSGCTASTAGLSNRVFTVLG